MSANITLMIDEIIENHRDKTWRREGDLAVENVVDAENFVKSVGFAYTLTDMRWACPSLYIAVCGRRDARMPRNMQKDPEASHAWVLKDEILRRGKVYYGKLSNKRAAFIAPNLLASFYKIFSIAESEEKEKLSAEALAILAVLREEWEMASSDLRKAAQISSRTEFSKAIDELQGCFKLIATNVVYQPKFTYIWGLIEGRFEKELLEPVEPITKQMALKEIARAYLTAVGETACGDLAKITGLSRVDAGIGNQSLVTEGYSVKLGTGIYRLSSLAIR